ncbi:GNAT family N-acetyltransferase (plasmid) [Pantoea agglomerans]|uniref:GNAT family N-acetyltransferase n=1 Tax=Enterobacter agglomerans TaxID=549 RepID=UPI0007E573BB|nr:GNAT family N-acetyltransferase [Pantoea agglomerans]WHU90001.1 GNAT family N-acetyltransferase [Pantoea agglomerans pv. gypsophilae]WNN36603.1 GNAT family N-acetyltransferase [Pantoea agglomerans]
MQPDAIRLCVRPVTPSDADDLFRIYGDPATNTFNPAGPHPDIQHSRAVISRSISHWESYGFGSWAISLRDNPDRIIGFGGLSIRRLADITINNLGYRFSTESWGKGLATEFANYAVSYGFNELQLPEIAAVVRANHLASQKVLIKAGLRHVRDIHDVENAPASMLFSLSQEEWKQERG